MTKKLVILLGALIGTALLFAALILMLHTCKSGQSDESEITFERTTPPKDLTTNLWVEVKPYLQPIPVRYNTPEYLTHGRSTEISIVLEPQGIETGVDRLEGMPGKVVTAMVQVSPQVQALLSGPADLVEIRPRGGDDAQRKTITSAAPVQWIWDVKAVGEGIAILHLELIAYISNRDEDTSFQVTAFRRPIPIEISTADRVKRIMSELNPIWGFVAIVIAGVAGLLAYFGWKPSFFNDPPNR
jgi:hypothetical protein